MEWTMSSSSLPDHPTKLKPIIHTTQKPDQWFKSLDGINFGGISHPPNYKQFKAPNGGPWIYNCKLQMLNVLLYIRASRRI